MSQLMEHLDLLCKGCYFHVATFHLDSQLDRCYHIERNQRSIGNNCGCSPFHKLHILHHMVCILLFSDLSKRLHHMNIDQLILVLNQEDKKCNPKKMCHRRQHSLDHKRYIDKLLLQFHQLLLIYWIIYRSMDCKSNIRWHQVQSRFRKMDHMFCRWR